MAVEPLEPFKVHRRVAATAAPSNSIKHPATERRKRRPAYSPEESALAVRSWAAQYGEPPTMLDWDPARARRLGHAWRADRFEAGEWPTARIVRNRFATFNLAIEAAGLRPRAAPARQALSLAGPQSVLDSLAEWVRRYGDVPTMADWEPARARRLGQDWRIARFHHGDWPSTRTVLHHFGSFRNAFQAAGLIAR